ncbi:MAG: thioredoxin domain-containing protein, partial [Armatimonadetes bacterium]|nr:thioredoxin domain-containing protein [Armatimonadota bacterium]
AYAVVMLVTHGAGGGFRYWSIQQDRAAVGGGPQGDMDVPFFRDEDLVIGNPDAPITIVEYADLYCPTCREMHAWLENRMEGDLKDRVRLVVRHFPLHTQHPKAVMTAMFAEWATEKGKGAEFVNRAFLLPEDADEEELFDLIGQIGLDPDEARLLLEHEALQDPYLFRVQQDMADGREFGVQSTPHWIIVYPDGRASWAVGEGLKYQLDSKKFRRYLQSLGR